MSASEEIFRRRFLPLYPRLYAVAAALLGNSDDAADAVQDTMTKIWSHANELADIRSPQSYALSIVRTSSIDIIRRRRDATLPPLEPQAPPAPEPDAHEFLARAIATLPEPQQEALKLNAFANLPADEIARIMNRSSADVRQLLSRGRRKLRELYRKYM